MKWKWHLLSIVNVRGNKVTTFQMKHFGEPYDIEKIGDIYRFKLPVRNGSVVGFGVKIIVE